MQSVLVVENGGKDEAVLKEILAKNGYFVHRVRTACEATTAMGAINFDLIIVDAGVPGRPDSVTRKAREHGIIALIIADEPETIAALEDQGAPYIARPYLVDDLLDIVWRHARRRPGIEKT